MTDIESQVCLDIQSRQRVGIRKYGVTVADNPLPLREWLEHAYQECLDQAIYLRRAMEEIPSPKPSGGGMDYPEQKYDPAVPHDENDDFD